MNSTTILQIGIRGSWWHSATSVTSFSTFTHVAHTQHACLWTVCSKTLLHMEFVFVCWPKGLPNPADIVPAVCSGCQLCYPFHLGLLSAALQSHDLLTHAVSFYSQLFILRLHFFLSMSGFVTLSLLSEFNISFDPHRFKWLLYKNIICIYSLGFHYYAILNISFVNVVYCQNNHIFIILLCCQDLYPK